MTTRSLICTPFLIGLIAVSFVSARANVSQKQARKAIAKAAGMVLPTSAVHIDKIASSNDSTAEVSAQLELVFRLAREQDEWRLKELRTGEAQWEDVNSFAQAIKINLQQNECNRLDEPTRAQTESDLSSKVARCLIAHLFSVSLPSDAVRIKEISALGLGTEPSALAVSLVQADFRLAKDSHDWHATEFRAGSGDWVNLQSLPNTLDSIKQTRTTDEMNAIAVALEAFRKARGSFVVSDKHAVLIDHLHPRFLTRVIRVDPWHHPFHYQGDRDHFTLRSLGPDGKENTPDDIVVSR
jgi:hypothetical protein